MEFRLLSNVLKRWWIVLLLAALLAGAAGFYASSAIPPQYSASARALVGPLSADFDTGRAASTNVTTFGELMTSQPVLAATIERVGIDTTPQEFLERVEVESDQTSRLITVTVTDTDPERAAETANALMEELQALAPEAEQAPGGTVTLVSPAVVPEEPTWPTPAMVVVLAVIAGIAAAVIGLILLEYLDNRVRGRYDLEQAVAAPFLGEVRVSRPLRRARGQSAVPVEWDSAAGALVSRVVGARGGTTTSLIVPSLEEGDEAAELAATVAAAAAASGRRVVLIDADDVSHRLSTAYPNLVGAGGSRPSAGIGTPGTVQLVGEQAANEGGQSQPAERLAEIAREGWDLVVVHAAPLHRSRLAVQWASAVDGALVAARSGQTSREQVEQVADTLQRLGTVVEGAAIVRVRRGSGSARELGAPTRSVAGGGSQASGRRGRQRAPASKDPAQT